MKLKYHLMVAAFSLNNSDACVDVDETSIVWPTVGDVFFHFPALRD